MAPIADAWTVDLQQAAGADREDPEGMPRGRPDGWVGSLPKLSIGMPVFNGARHFEASIGSILSQTFTDFELIISDNARRMSRRHSAAVAAH